MALPLYVVPCFREARVTGTMGAAEQLVAAFDSVADDATSAMLANRGQLRDRAFEAVKHVAIPGRDYFETQFVFVSANFTLCHTD